jgi:glycosyltransferase involved in cell wall biosynthesis
MTQLVYIANARLPTEKAQGYQICKMCEAFAHNDVSVLLMHPKRYQVDPVLGKQSIFDYYGITPTFTVRPLPNWDVVRLSPFIPDKVFIPFFFVHAFLWGLYAAVVARREMADLYFTRDSSVAFWLLQMGLPTVYEAHDIAHRGQRVLLQWIAQYPALRLVVTTNSFIKKWFIERGFPAERILVLPNGVDFTHFEDLPDKETCRQLLNLPLDRSIIGYVGRFQTLGTEKGIPELIEAVAQWPSHDGKEPLLLCIGGPMDTVSVYLDLGRRLGIPAHWLRFVDRVPNWEVPYWIRACDVTTIPFPDTEHYAYFTSPLKLFEYMAAGVPIVATALPSLQDILRHGDNAWLVESNDAKALMEGIRSVLHDATLSNRIAQQARQDVNHFSWNARASAILHHLKPIP